MTTADELMHEARESSGLRELGSDHFVPLLEAVVRDLNGDTLNDRGQKVVRRMAVETLVRRLRVLETIRLHPEILEVELPPLVLISGLPRTGTTLLHNLVDRHELVRTLASWELKDPLPPPRRETYDSDPRIERAERIVDGLRGSPFERIHWVEARDPDENQHAFLDLHGLFGRAASAVLPNWHEAATGPDVDMRPTFEELRSTLQLLLWRNQPSSGQLLVLKDPTTTPHLATFLEVFDGSRAVVVHRDPHRVVQSVWNLQAAAVAGLAAAEPVPLVGGITDGLAGISAACDADPGRLHHVPYPSLASDPVEQTVELLAELGLTDDSGEFRGAADAYVAWQRGGGRAAPPAQYDTPYEDPSVLYADPVVAAYMERFEVLPETTRRTS